MYFSLINFFQKNDFLLSEKFSKIVKTNPDHFQTDLTLEDSDMKISEETFEYLTGEMQEELDSAKRGNFCMRKIIWGIWKNRKCCLGKVETDI